MKNVKSLKTYLILCMALALSVTITSCGDDESTPDIISVKDVVGDYAGKMLNAAPTPQRGNREAQQLGNREAQQPGTVDVTAVLNDKEVVFDQFPVEGIITAIVGEEAAAGIIEAVGDVTYKLAYTAELNKEYTEIGLTFAPQPLELEVTLPSSGDGARLLSDEVRLLGDGVREGEAAEPMKIVVTISTPQNGLFTYEGRNLKFALNIDKIVVDGVDFPYTTALNFHLSKVK